MMALSVVLRNRVRAMKSRSLVASLGLCFALLVLLWFTPSGATRADASGPPYNMAPGIDAFYSTYLGQGMWKVTGHVIDDQSPVGLIVNVWGPAVGRQDVTEVISNSTFTYGFFIVGPGAVYAQTTDEYGAVSNVATTMAGY